MGFFDDIFNEDIIWVILLLFLVFILPKKCTEPILKNKCDKEEEVKCKEDIINRNTRRERERRRLVY